MPVENLNFQGINRAISDYSSAGACEELINLRPTTGGLVPVKPFSVKMAGVNYDKVYTHYAGSDVNYIAIRIVNGALKILQLSDDGQTATSIFPDIDISTYTHFSLSDIHFATVGNIVLFSIADREDAYYQNISLIWSGSEYNPQEADVPQIGMTITPGATPLLKQSTVTPNYTASSSQAEIISQIAAAVNALQEEQEDLCFGPVLIALAFKTTDGKTFWTGHWQVYDPTPEINAYSSYSTYFYLYRGGPTWSTYESFFATHTYGYQVRPQRASNLSQFIQMAGVKLTLGLTMSASWNPDTSIIRSVEVYASKPKLYTDAAVDYGMTVTDNTYGTGTILPGIPYDNMDLENQLLYLQKSIPLEQLSSTPYLVEMKFGGNNQLTNETLVVDSGAVTRFGDLLAYNARFHFFDSVSKFDVDKPGVFPTSANDNYSDVLVVYKTAEDTRMVLTGTVLCDPANAKLIIAPSINITEVILLEYQDYTVQGYLSYAKYRMNASSTYNYSIGYDAPYETGSYQDTNLPDDIQAALDAGTGTPIILEEPSAINVTEQYNAFVFNVKNSYLAPGKVLNIQPQLMAVADISIGNAPLDVFTNRGVYALLQGNGDVLYGAFQSLSNLVSKSNSVSTESGTFFIAAGGLWVVAGLHAVLVSDALSLGPHTFIRDCAGYQQLANSGSVYNIKSYESSAIFEDYIKKATLSYNRFRDELIISNPDYAYSYILSLKYRQWFKIDKTISQDVIGADIAVLGSNGTVAVPGLVATAHIDDRWAHDYQGGEIEIEIEGQNQGGLDVFYMDYVHTFTSDESQNIQLAIQRIVNSWNNSYGDTITASYGGASGEHAYDINFTIMQMVPDTSVILANLTFTATSPEEEISEDFEFPAPDFDIVDFSDETENVSQLVHLQSRPFSIGYQYIHVHRIVSMIRANLSASNLLVVALYGSDNLQDWTLLTYSDRSNVKVSQIRTPSAARSWRYYTITIGGTTPVDTDFGTVMFDYQPVIRRIG